MSYFINSSSLFKTIQKAPGFEVTVTSKTNESFSMSYLSLNNSRDPGELDKVIEINEGYSCIYIVIKGKIEFHFRDDDIKTELKEKEYMYVTPGTQYELRGTGEIALIVLPAYTKDTFSHPSK